MWALLSPPPLKQLAFQLIFAFLDGIALAPESGSSLSFSHLFKQVSSNVKKGFVFMHMEHVLRFRRWVPLTFYLFWSEVGTVDIIY